MNYIFITNDPGLASHSENSGVDRIMLDLERLGKRERQGHLDTLISNHNIGDIPGLINVLKSAELMVRINPVNEHTEDEINAVIEHGANLIMLPMYKTIQELKRVIAYIDGRAKFIPLLETAAAYNIVEDTVTLNGVDEIYIGLNDLHLDMGLKFIFEPLINGCVENVAINAKNAGVPFGFGGIARIGESAAITADLILAAHYKFGSSMVILSRAFHDKSNNLESFKKKGIVLDFEIDKLNSYYKGLSNKSSSEIGSLYDELSDNIIEILGVK